MFRLTDYEQIVGNFKTDLDNLVMRSKLIASNIANVDTPGYTSKDLKFTKILEESMNTLKMKRTDFRHMGETPLENGLMNEIVENPNPGRPDGNNVDIDDEMLKLSENNIQYNVSVQLLSKKMRQISDAIQQAK